MIYHYLKINKIKTSQRPIYYLIRRSLPDTFKIMFDRAVIPACFLRESPKILSNGCPIEAFEHDNLIKNVILEKVSGSEIRRWKIDFLDIMQQLFSMLQERLHSLVRATFPGLSEYIELPHLYQRAKPSGPEASFLL